MATISEAMFRYALRGVALVVFKKVTNNMHRFMRCTQNLALVPPEQHPHMRMPYVPGLLRVYDLELGLWRSFYMNTVHTLKILEPKK